MWFEQARYGACPKKMGLKWAKSPWRYDHKNDRNEVMLINVTKSNSFLKQIKRHLSVAFHPSFLIRTLPRGPMFCMAYDRPITLKGITFPQVIRRQPTKRLEGRPFGMSNGKPSRCPSDRLFRMPHSHWDEHQRDGLLCVANSQPDKEMSASKTA